MKHLKSYKIFESNTKTENVIQDIEDVLLELEDEGMRVETKIDKYTFIEGSEFYQINIFPQTGRKFIFWNEISESVIRVCSLLKLITDDPIVFYVDNNKLNNFDIDKNNKDDVFERCFSINIDLTPLYKMMGKKKEDQEDLQNKLKRFNESTLTEFGYGEMEHDITDIFWELKDEGYKIVTKMGVVKIPAPSLIRNGKAIRQESINEEISVDICSKDIFFYSHIQDDVERLKDYMKLNGFGVASQSCVDVSASREPGVIKYINYHGVPNLFQGTHTYYYHKICFYKRTTV